MSRKPAGKKATKAKPKPKKPARVYVAVRKLPSEVDSYTEPDRVFATRAAAQKHADRLNRELRELTNPFADDRDPDSLTSGDEDDFRARLKAAGVPDPQKRRGDAYLDWEAWWDRTAPDLTAAQRDAVWDALDEFEWYAVRETTLEG